ncbi:Sodium:solute symporter family protein [Cardinium endosymbiont of Sogatella furcifera]|uniref:sodium:solute symporter family protein n=1 Tax=Cardinium endosymbiont of Sogatella furcifera TaxID=650378 RepID=UPI000E0D6AFE|nr:hypothetical protein [Cardinium endosymbiont of Sogatella furcifera]AXI24251.1 Sodium:solute symporter family protein [Cardinium endosymbiont of Sogatella furcifera]
MVSLNSPLLIIGAFLLLTLVVGLTSKQATTFRAYAVDTKRLSTVKLLATLLGTSFCGVSLLSPVEVCYSAGLSKVVLTFMRALTLWLTSLMWIRMAPFIQHLSIAGTIGSIYGKYPRIIVALLATCSAISVVKDQINAISTMITICLDSINPTVITVLATLTLMLYATLGGIRSVTNTDVLQCITFVIIIALIAKLMFEKIDNPTLDIVSFLHNQEKFKLSSLFHRDRQPLNLLFYIPFSCFIIADPGNIQRIYMCASPAQVKKVFLYGSLLYLVIMFFVCLIGLFVFAGNPTLSIPKIWPYIISNMPSCFKISVVICVLGMAMSTADSYLHLCSVMVAHDLMESIRGVKPISYLLQIRVAKLTALACGSLAMLIAIYSSGLLIDHRIAHALNIFDTIDGSIIPPLFILAVFGFRGTARTALIGIAIGILASLACNQWGFTIGFAARLTPAIANSLGMMAAHYLLPQPAGTGWVGLDAQQKRIQQLTKAFKRHKKILDLE